MGAVWEQIERSPWLVARSVIKFRQRAELKSVINTWTADSSSSAHLFCSFHNKFPATWALCASFASCALCILASYQELDCNSIYCCICHAKRLLGRKREWLKQDRPTGHSPQPVEPEAGEMKAQRFRWEQVRFLAGHLGNRIYGKDGGTFHKELSAGN